VQRRRIPRGPSVLALENELDGLPAGETLTHEESLRVVAALDEVSDYVKRRKLELWVTIAPDEYRGSIPIRRTKQAS
jgi:hypothetical protein